MIRVSGKRFYGYEVFKYLYPIDGGYEQCLPNHCNTAVRDYWLLHYVVSGEGEYKVGNKIYKPQSGQIFVIHPSEFMSYKADSDNPWHYIWIGFKTDFELPKLITENYVIDGELFRSVFLKIQSQAEAGIFESSEFYGFAWELLGKITEGTEQKVTDTYETAMKAKNFIEMHYSDRIYIKDIADMMHLDRSYFYVIFKKHVGVSPQKYLNDYRLKRSAQYLVNGMTPGKTAVACGYSDVFVFSKMFKRKYGVSPSKYKDLHNMQ